MSSTPTPPEAENQLEGASTGSRPALRNPGLWMVPGDRGRYVDDFVTGGYAGVDSDVDLSDLPSVGQHDELRTRYERQHPDKTPHQIGGHVWHLAKVLDMEEGDYVLTPERNSDWIRFGQIVGPWYCPEEADRCPYRNRRPVRWSNTLIARRRLSEGFRQKLGVGGTTVFRLPFWEEFRKVAELNSTGTAADREPSGQPQHTPAPVTAVPQSAGVPVSPSESEPRTAFTQTADNADKGDKDEDNLEQENKEGADFEHPFDPSRIKVRTITIVVAQLLARHKYGEIDLAPDFQRRPGVWKDIDKSRLIESLLLRIPIPVFYVAADEDEHWAVVDGLQRIHTIAKYVSGEFPLKQLEYRDELNGLRFADLPRSMQRRIDETQLTVNVIEPGTPPEVMFNIFRRINTGGEPLRAQEIRHALNPGPVREMLKELAESSEFRKATGGISSLRMADRECVLRFLAFLPSWEEYPTDSLDGYLNNAMKKLNSLSPYGRQVLRTVFRQSMRDARRLLGDTAFRKRYRGVDRRYPINKPLFEAWSVALARRSEKEIDPLVARRDHLGECFMDLLEHDAEFKKAISESTGTRWSVRKRFGTIQELLGDVIQ